MNGHMIIALLSFFIIMKRLEHVYLSNWLGPLCINLFCSINQFPNQTQNASLIFSHAHDLDKRHRLEMGKSLLTIIYGKAMNHLTANFLCRTWLIPFSDWLDNIWKSKYRVWPWNLNNFFHTSQLAKSFIKQILASSMCAVYCKTR